MASATPPSASARFNTGYDSHVRDRYASRTVADSGMYLLPHLDRLYTNTNNNNNKDSGIKQGRPAFTFLDVGCGPGSITIDFAQRFPRAFFMGVDPGESFISAATSRAAQLGVDNVLFVVGDVFELEEVVNRGVKEGGLEDRFGGGGTGGVMFDVVSCHQVLSHLSPSQRGRALRNMHAVAARKQGGGGGRDGGIVAAREAELEGLMSIHPETRLLSQWRRLFYSVLRSTHLSNEPSPSTPATAAGEAGNKDDDDDDDDDLEKRFPGLGSTFAGKYLLSTALSTGLWTRQEVAVTGSLNSHSEQAEKDSWVASIAPMLEDEGSSWNKRAVEYLTSPPGRGGGREGEDRMRGLTRDEALAMMKDLAGAWRDWARDNSAWLGIGSCEVVCRCSEF